ncbi:MAG: pyruvate carboxylase subunit B [Clostridia bacterium]|nr:pyruvate carboxylase subunit B [Clostridia bacterium]
MRTVKLTETVLRDANQSLIATRMTFAQMEPALKALDEAGFYSLECWGGATFDACLRYLDEDPWERLRAIRRACPKTPLQMLLRGQNLLGYRHYPDDAVRLFVRKSVENGISILRVFDALNDVRNIEVAVDETLKCGAHASGAICFTLSPIHTLEHYVATAKEMEALGVQSICIKDMAGIMGPKDVFDIVTAFKQELSVPVVVHTHMTTGLGLMTLQKAVEAGADIVDTAIASFSGGSSQPPTETFAYAMRQQGFRVELDDECLRTVNRHFKALRGELLASGQLNPIVLSTETDALTYQVPGGMLSNLVSQLTAQNQLHRLDEVLAETPKVRAELGYPPLVTPMSQMVGAQATSNVLAGERYKTVSKEVKSYLRGEYGKAPGPVDEALRAQILGDEPPLSGRYADGLEPALPAARAHLGEGATEEDLLSYIAFPAQADEFFARRAQKQRRRLPYQVTAVADGGEGGC